MTEKTKKILEFSKIVYIIRFHNEYQLYKGYRLIASTKKYPTKKILDLKIVEYFIKNKTKTIVRKNELTFPSAYVIDESLIVDLNNTLVINNSEIIKLCIDF